MNKVKKVIHRKLGRERSLGLAFCEDGEIHIDERLKGIEYLDTIIHEVMHVQNPRWSEIKVQGHATEMARILWDVGIRRITELLNSDSPSQ